MPTSFSSSSSSSSSSSTSMSPAALFVQVGFQSFEDLSNAFLQTLWGTNDNIDGNNDDYNNNNIICSAGATSVGGGGLDETTTTTTTATFFHLHPWDQGGSVWTMKPIMSSSHHHNQQNTHYHHNINANIGPVSCAGTDWIVLLLLVCIIHTISWVPRWFVWEPLADTFQHERSRRQKKKSKQQQQLNTTTNPNTSPWNAEECRRFSMTITSCMFFTLSAIFGYRVLIHKSWLFHPLQWTVRSTTIESDFKFYYLLYAARFISDSISLFFESRNFDAFIAAILHHIVTLGLVFGSASTGLIRYGGIIMFFFDWADIPLLAAKACKYLSNSPTDTFQQIANRLFEVFAVTFFVTRIVFYNYVVYHAWKDLPYDWDSRCLQYLLLLLVGLQTYWMGLIVQAAIRQQQNGGVVEDSRDDGLRNTKEKTN